MREHGQAKKQPAIGSTFTMSISLEIKLWSCSTFSFLLSFFPFLPPLSLSFTHCFHTFNSLLTTGCRLFCSIYSHRSKNLFKSRIRRDTLSVSCIIWSIHITSYVMNNRHSNPNYYYYFSKKIKSIV
jgi:hypothetical protein